MRSAPPIAPGIPRKNASPASPASCAARPTLTSGTAAPARMRPPASTLTSPKPRPRRMTTPGTPPSRTIRFEPSPMTTTGIAAGRWARKSARSASSSGMNRTCAGPPTRNQVSSASDWFAIKRPRSVGMRPLSSATRSGDIMATRAQRAYWPRSSRHRPQRGELARQRIGPLGDVAGAETHDDVAGLRQPLDHARKVLRAVERNDLPVPVRAQTLHQGIAVGTGDRRFAGRIDVRDDYGVGVVEAGRELLEQRCQAGIAVRLHHGDHLALARLARSAQHGGDLDRMVAVVVDDRHAIPFAGAGEATSHAAKISKRRADHVVGNTELAHNRDCGGGIERVVAAGHRQRQAVDFVHRLAGAVAEQNREARAALGMVEI